MTKPRASRSGDRSSAARRLRRLLRGRPVLIAGVYDALSALLAEKAGFSALYLSGGGLSVSLLGRPDVGLLTLDEVAFCAARIASAVRPPLLVDADTGFGGPANVYRTVRELEAAGAAGIQIEDQTFPKRCGHLAGKSVIPANEMAAKIRAAVSARRDPAFVVVARTDARAVTGLKDALARAEIYKRAGADVIFPEALQTREEFQIFGRKKNLGALIANMTEFGRSPALAVSDLAHLGYQWILYPMTAFRIAARAMENGLYQLKRDGGSARLLDRMQTRRELYALNRYGDFDRWEQRMAAGRKKVRKKGS